LHPPLLNPSNILRPFEAVSVLKNNSEENTGRKMKKKILKIFFEENRAE
jgi:hypothetical protein